MPYLLKLRTSKTFHRPWKHWLYANENTPFMHIFVVFATTVQAALSRSLAAAPGSPLHPAWASLGVVQQTAAKGGAWLPRSTHPATHPRINRTALPDFVHSSRMSTLMRSAWVRGVSSGCRSCYFICQDDRYFKGYSRLFICEVWAFNSILNANNISRRKHHI